MRMRYPVIVSLLLLASLLYVILLHPGLQEGENVKLIAMKIDGAIWSLRHGDNQRASTLIGEAKEKFSELKIENENLNAYLREIFENVRSNPTEGNCHKLRREVLKGLASEGHSLPFVYAHATCLTLLVSVLAGFLYACLLKKSTNWERVREIRSKLDDFDRRFRDAKRRKDFKELHKLTQEAVQLMPLRSELMLIQTRPSLLFLPFWFGLYLLLNMTYSGWVIAWLPFGITLPFWGYWTSCGTLSWMFLSFSAFSSFWKVLIVGE